MIAWMDMDMMAWIIYDNKSMRNDEGAPVDSKSRFQRFLLIIFTNNSSTDVLIIVRKHTKNNKLQASQDNEKVAEIPLETEEMNYFLWD